MCYCVGMIVIYVRRTITQGFFILEMLHAKYVVFDTMNAHNKEKETLHKDTNSLLHTRQECFDDPSTLRLFKQLSLLLPGHKDGIYIWRDRGKRPRLSRTLEASGVLCCRHIVIQRGKSIRDKRTKGRMKRKADQSSHSCTNPDAN